MERQGGPNGGCAVVAYGMCNGLGLSTEEVVAALSGGRSSLARPWIDLPFEAVCGSLPEQLPALPARLATFDTRVARMAALALDGIRPAVTRAAARWGSDRVGAIVGTSTGGLATTEAAFAERGASSALPAWFDFERQHPLHVVVDFVCASTDIRGPRYAVSTACSSSAKAFGAAARLMAAGVCDAVVVGGVDTLCQVTLRGFHALGVLSPEPCRPFSRDRRGINIGEGAAFLLLERDAEGPARYLGSGESSDAHHMSAPDPEGRGARLAMELALRSARLSPSDVDYVNAHGTGTLKSDGAEAMAIGQVFGGSVAVASTKGYTGHLLGAGGATEAAFCVASIERGFVPASVGAQPIEEGLPIRVAVSRTEIKVRAAISNSLAFGGSNASLAFGAPA